MIDSFRSSLLSWLDATLTADLYVSLDAQDGAFLDSAQLDSLLAIEGISGISLARSMRLPSNYGDLGLRAVAPGPEGWGLQIVAGSLSALEASGAADVVAISEPLAYRLGLGIGDRMDLPTPDGPRLFTVAAVFRDYNTGGSGLLMALPLYRRIWQDRSLSSLGIHTLGRGDEEAVIGAIVSVLRDALGREEDFSIRSSAAIEGITMRIFDRTFRITEVLRLLAGFIAFLGVLSAMLAIQLERSRELAILRGLGFSPRDLAVQVLAQTGLLGLCAGVAALPLGAGLSALLVHVINRRSFGWTMELKLTLEPMALGLALALGAALLAGIYPAWHSARTGLDAALRDE
jgi:putative ABC transport system permease protein